VKEPAQPSINTELRIRGWVLGVGGWLLSFASP
jgi:hypothetical protein